MSNLGVACPFCGGHDGYHVCRQESAPGHFYAECACCHARGPLMPTKLKAMDWWTRTILTRFADMVPLTLDCLRAVELRRYAGQLLHERFTADLADTGANND